ncbi:penicillin-binding transpeptidase domain-containing protein [Streptomyces uncialis]|uniref:penicillin-binding transpeptidase domain-containing protein n=1 Tax=Streptomyces uncialis TaxID=1048205 RepID=UPI0033F0FAF2
MPLPPRRPVAVFTAMATLLVASLSGCSTDSRGGDEGGKPTGSGGSGGATDTKPPTPKPDGGLGDVLVDGRRITGSKPTGIAKVPFARTYTEGALYSAVTGYRAMMFGTAGLEGLAREKIDAGTDLATTIDPAVQRAAFDALRGQRGGAIALDAETGDIVALVSAPSFDPGSFSGNTFAEEKVWKRLNEDDDKPMLNRPLRNSENPGSAAHVVVAAAALEKGLLASVDTPTRSPAVHVVPGSATEFSGDPGRCTDAALRAALRYSCANVFARIAADLGAEALASTAAAFGFRQETLLTPVRAGESAWPDRPGNATQLALTANGLFEVKATAVQMAMLMAAIGNGGNRPHPQLLVDPVEPESAGRAVSRRTADQLRSTLGASVTTWVPSASVTWALSYTRTAAGRPLAVAVCFSSAADATEQGARIAQRIAAADQEQPLATH